MVGDMRRWFAVFLLGVCSRCRSKSSQPLQSSCVKAFSRRPENTSLDGSWARFPVARSPEARIHWLAVARGAHLER